MSEQKISNQNSSELRMRILTDYFTAQAFGKPKSTRLFEAFLKMIEGGYWNPGDRIPSELQLTENLPVGLATVQSALRKLSDEGLIQRKRKAGSFVTDPSSVARELFFYKFLADDNRKNLPLTDVYLSVEEIKSQGFWVEFLGSHEPYIRVERVINVGGYFHMFSQLFLAYQKFHPLLDIPVSELMDVNFRIVFRDRFGITFTKSDRRISFSQLSLEQAEMLDCNYGLPAIQYDVRQYTLRDKPLFFMRTIIPQNNRVLQVATAY